DDAEAVREAGRGPRGGRGASARGYGSGVHVAVVGAGIMGAATAYALARDGVDVLVLEQFRVGHARGSSHGRTRIVRLAYPQAKWVRLAAEAMQGWRELEAETGERLIDPLGMLELVEHVDHSSQDALRA